MCVIFWTVNDAQYDLVIASNRDEFLARPTLPASWHDFDTSDDPDSHRILSARDATGGGTWLGVTRNGAFATLTNFTEPPPRLPAGLEAFESRGRLVRDWLSQATAMRGKQDVEELSRRIEKYLAEVQGKLDRFPGFNLLVGGVSDQGTVVGYITNRTPEGKLATQGGEIFLPQSEGGVGACRGMSNSVLSHPWPKVHTGTHAFASALQRASSSPDRHETQDQLVEDLYEVLATSPSAALKQRSEMRSSILIPPVQLPTSAGSEWYATRTATIILISKAGSATLVERDIHTLSNSQPTRLTTPTPSAQRSFSWTLD